MSSRNRLLLIAALATVFLAFLSLSGCGGKATDKSAEQATETPAEETTQTQEGSALYTPEYKPNGDEVAVMKTSKGDITIKLYGKDAPIHVGNFVELAKKGFYDKTKFHRYEPGFVVQGGDPQTKDFSSEEVSATVAKQNIGEFDPNGPMFGTGGPGYTIAGEFDASKNPNKHTVGALGMARSQSPDSAGSQFYFALQPLPQLDGSYTVFGVVTDGLDVMKELRIGDEILSIEIRGASE